MSVVVPAHNRADVIERTLRSLLAQDLQEAYEILVVDDGSRDATAKIVTGFGHRVRLIRQRNQGAAVARHVGVKAARAPIVVFHDSDDLAPPCKLSSLVGALRAHPDCVAAFGVTWDPQQPEGYVPRWFDGCLDGRCTVVRDPFSWLVTHGGPVAEAMNLATRRELALQSSRGRSFYRAANDYDLQIRLARHGDFVHVARVTCLYVPNSEGISSRFGAFRQAAYALCAADDAMRGQANPGLRAAYADRVQYEWPRVAVGLWSMRDWRLLRCILALACRHAAFRNAPRALWWTLDAMADDYPERMPAWLKELVWLGRAVRRPRNHAVATFADAAS